VGLLQYFQGLQLEQDSRTDNQVCAKVPDDHGAENTPVPLPDFQPAIPPASRLT
jgi:hypothetical protein